MFSLIEGIFSHIQAKHKFLIVLYIESDLINRIKYFYISKNIVDKYKFQEYIRKMENETAAKRLSELGHPTRLSIFRYLVKVGDGGAPVGQIQNELGVPGSTLSHHINRLVSVGLIRQVRESRILYCLPQYEVLRELIDFLQAECCTGEICKT